MDFSFVIVSYNSGEYLNQCLTSLVESIASDLIYEIVIVDNGSNDGTIADITALFPQVVWIKNEKNIGYTRAMNQGLRIAKGKYLVQLNPDVIVLKQAFQNLFVFMEDNPTVGICTPKVLSQDGNLQRQCHRSFARPWDVLSYFLKLDRIFPKSRLFGRYLMTYLPENEIAEVAAVSGSCMVIRRDVVNDIGFLDEQFFAYQEDTDFCLRAYKANWRVIYFPKSHILHYGGMGGSGNEPLKSIKAWHSSYFLYYKKNLANDYFFLINWMMYFAMAFKLLLAYLKFIFFKDKQVGTKKP